MAGKFDQLTLIDHFSSCKSNIYVGTIRDLDWSSNETVMAFLILKLCVLPVDHYFVRQTSKCCTEFMEDVQAGVEEDTLVKGIAEDNNPFKELKDGCVVC